MDVARRDGTRPENRDARRALERLLHRDVVVIRDPARVRPAAKPGRLDERYGISREHLCAAPVGESRIHAVLIDVDRADGHDLLDLASLREIAEPPRLLCGGASGEGVNQSIRLPPLDEPSRSEQISARTVKVLERRKPVRLVRSSMGESHLMACLRQLAHRGGADEVGTADESHPHPADPRS